MIREVITFCFMFQCVCYRKYLHSYIRPANYYYHSDAGAVSPVRLSALFSVATYVSRMSVLFLAPDEAVPARPLA